MALIGNFKSQMLWENIQKKDLTAVVNLLENGTINVEERDDNGQTFLMVACQQGEVSMVRELLEAGLDLNAVDNDNWSALLYAAKDGHLEITIELLERGADIEHRDLCSWTPLMWATYKGQETVVQELLDRGADPNIKAEHNMSCLCWAAGRGHAGVVKALIQKGAKVNSTDKYGTTPLLWACRKGHLEVAQELLDNGASVDNTGMDSLTAVLVATKGGFTEVIQALMEHDPNVNALDKDGFTALTIAAKEGYEGIAQELLAKDAYVNVADRVGDTILIHAVKGGYINIVRALLNRYADVDVEGAERKTALYWAVEKHHADIVKLLLDNDADMEITTKDGDTPLMRAVRNRHELTIRLLLDKGAKVAVYDKKGDNALHISLRARSKRITELLLRNPRNSRLLYRPNKSGETPYSIDAYHEKGILTQIHGHRELNASDGENLLGYEIYSSSLADILSEPSLNTPITVGLYAKWGSGKSFLIGKLKHEMKAFTKANEENQLTFTWSLLIFLLIINCLIGSVLAIAGLWQLGIGVGLGLFVLEYGFLGIIWFCSKRHNVRFAQRISQAIGKRLQILALLLQVLFCNSVSRTNTTTDVPLVKFLFSESTKLTSVGGEKALAAMVAGLSESVEKEFGMLSARLFGVIKQASKKNYIGRFRTICCIPVFVIVVFVLLCLIAGIALFVTKETDDDKVINGFMIAFACIVGLSLLSNIHTFGKALYSLCIPQKNRVMKVADNLHRVKMDGFMQILKKEVNLMNNFVTSMDKFTKNTTRLVVVVDGLDSCEQEKVLQVLDIIHALFNEENSPFVVILAVDPQIIIKGINQNLKSQFQDTSVNGFDYLRNIVHLPFYLQSQGMKIKRQDMTKSVSTYDVGHESPQHNHKAYRHKDSTISRLSGFTICEPMTFQHQDSTVSQISGFSVMDPSAKKNRNRPHQDSITQVTHSNFDISHTLTKNDYFSDINPKSMRRLMNIVAVTGRLLRAYNIDFNWYRLAAWVNLVEQWPYRLSWIILHFEEEDDLDDDITMKFIYNKIENQMPVSSEVEPLLEIDRNVRKLEAFLASKSASANLNIGDLKKFLPCTINLDPYLRKLIRNLQKQVQQPELPLGLFGPPPGPPPGNMTDNPELGKNNLRTTLNRKPAQPTVGGIHMTPYGPMGVLHHAQMMGMPPYMMGMPVGGYGPYIPNMGMVDVPSGKNNSNPEQYIEGYNGEVLSKMTTAEVSTLLSHLKGLNAAQLQRYQQAVEDNNINGRVLSQCDLDALGKCLDMKFGDWQLFRSAVTALRNAEDNAYVLEEAQAVAATDNSATNARSNGDSQSARSIHFAATKNDSVVSASKTFEEQDFSRTRSFKRQTSVDTQCDTTDSPSLFNVIPEEAESLGQPKGVIRRNDSVVDEMMYESGLLHKFMHNFTETVSEEEDNGEEEEEERVITMNHRPSDASLTKPPVQFTLPTELSSSMLFEDSNNANSQTSLRFRNDPDSEPLMSESQRTESERSLPGNKYASPTPILKLPKTAFVTKSREHKPSGVHSEPDLTNRTVIERQDTRMLEMMPLLSNTVMATSTGFTERDIQASINADKDGDSVSIVDETTSDRSSSTLSLQNSVYKYTLQDAKTRQVSQSSNGSQSSVADTFEDSQLITQKSKKDSKKPESFV